MKMLANASNETHMLYNKYGQDLNQGDDESAPTGLVYHNPERPHTKSIINDLKSLYYYSSEGILIF